MPPRSRPGAEGTHPASEPPIPKHVEMMAELPKTAVGKVFKPDLRRRAITRVYDAALAEAGVAARVRDVREDKKLGLVAHLEAAGDVDEAAISQVLGQYTRPWVLKPS
jgi:hypothetical protein